MKTPESYKDKESVQEALKEGLDGLVKFFRSCKDGNNSSYNFLILLGRYKVYCYTNTARFYIFNPAPIDHFPLIPDILYEHESNQYIDYTINKMSELSVLPLGNSICPVCRFGWSMYNLYDVKMIGDLLSPTFYHKTCYKYALTEDLAKNIKSFFEKAGFEKVVVEVFRKITLSQGEIRIIFYVHTEIGTIEVIDCDGTIEFRGRLCGLDFSKLDEAEQFVNVTKGFTKIINPQVVSALQKVKRKK